jgi:hypothetical protein
MERKAEPYPTGIHILWEEGKDIFNLQVWLMSRKFLHSSSFTFSVLALTDLSGMAKPLGNLHSLYVFILLGTE